MKRKMNKTPVNSKRATAMHEAGHAVTHVYFRLPIDFVSIQEKGAAAGTWLMHRHCSMRITVLEP